MKKIIAMVILCTIFITGCSNSTYNSYMEKGKTAVIDEEYKKSKEFFGLAIEEKPNDNEAKALEAQISKLIEVIKLYEEEKYEEVINLCDEIMNLQSESNVVQNKSDSLKKECESKLDEFNRNKDEIDAELIDIEKLIDNKDYKSAKSKLEDLIRKLEDNNIFNNELEKAKELLETCKVKIEEKKSSIQSTSNKNTYGYDKCKDVAIQYAEAYLNLEPDQQFGLFFGFPIKESSYEESGIWHIVFELRDGGYVATIGVNTKTLEVVSIDDPWNSLENVN